MDCIKLLFFFVCIYVIGVHLSNAATQPCMQKMFNSSSFVCVCNSTYCDTIEPETRLPAGKYSVYASSKHGSRFNKTTHSFQRDVSLAFNISVKIRIDVTVTKQTIVGFGGTMTDAAGINIAALPKGGRVNLIDTYYGPSGIEYTLLRIPIASNEMSEHVYSYDFTNGDTMLSKFTIAGTDHRYKIPFIDQAVGVSRRNVSLYASPWSSPGWMKTNGHMVGVGSVAANMSKPYANYLARFIREYDSFMFNGRMWGLTTQSGPTRGCNNASKPKYQSMCWTAEQTREWVVNDLKPSLKTYGYDHIKVLVMDDNRDVLGVWGSAFDDEDAKDAIDGFAVQWYHDIAVSPSVLAKHQEQYPNKMVLGSESSIRRERPTTVELGSWERGELLARSIFQDLQNYVAGFTDYNLAVDMDGGPSWVNYTADGAVVVDAEKRHFYKQPMFYVMGHFSKFIPPGSKAVNVTMVGALQALTPAVAFLRPDDSVVLVVANLLEDDLDIQVADGDDVINYTLEKSSIQTFIWWKK